MTYIDNANKEAGCIFCNAQAKEDSPENLIIHRGRLAFVILNRYPYTSGHVMVVPFVHKPNLEELDSGDACRNHGTNVGVDPCLA